jgi:hypothetical protein
VVYRLVATNHVPDGAVFVTKPVAKYISAVEHVEAVLADHIGGCVTE